MLLIVSLVCLISIMLLYSISIAVDDIRSLRLQRTAARHPHARWRRNRPLIAFYIVGGNHRDQTTTVNNIQAIRYKHKVVHLVKHAPLFPASMPSINIPAGTTLTQQQLVCIVQRLNATHTHLYQVAPDLVTIRTTTDLLGNYRRMFAAITAKAYNGAQLIAPRCSRLPYALFIVRMLAQLCLSIVIITSTYLSFMLGESDILLSVVVAGIIASLALISTDSRLSVSSRLYYSLLSPMSYLYFYLVRLLTPLGIAWEIASRVRTSRNVREYDQS